MFTEVTADEVPPSPEGALRRTWTSVTGWEAGATDRCWVTAMVVLAAALRVPRLGIAYWGDEAISVGIASRPLAQIPHYLRFDGSPPLYYVLLHWWMTVFGTSPVATHSLSMLFALVAIPVAWWCARALFGARAGRTAALFAAVAPYLTYYGTETRMYVLVGVLSMVAVTGFVRAYHTPWPDAPGPLQGAEPRWRWRDDPARRWLALSATASVLMLYTHNWGLFLVGALVLVGVTGAWRARDRLRWRRTARYAGVVTVAYLPWLSSFFWQLHYTGAPWSPRPGPLAIILNPLDALFSATTSSVEAVGAVTSTNLLSDAGFVATWTAVAIAAIALVARRQRRQPRVAAAGDDTAVDPHAAVSNDQARARAVSMAAVLAVTIAAGWLSSQFVHAWATRYLGVAIVPLILLAAGAEVICRRARHWRCILAAAMAATALPVMVNPPAATQTKSNVAAIDLALGGALHAGDVVITTAASELPVIAYYLPAGLRYVTATGSVHDPTVVDWVDLSSRLASADPQSRLVTFLGLLPVGTHLLLVNPLAYANSQTPAAYAGIVSAEGVSVNQAVLTDPSFTVLRTVSPPHPAAVANPVAGVLLVKSG